MWFQLCSHILNKPKNVRREKKSQTSKKKSNDCAKQKLVEDAVHFDTQMETLNKECEYLENTKASQTTIITESVSTQTTQTREIGMQAVDEDYTRYTQISDDETFSQTTEASKRITKPSNA